MILRKIWKNRQEADFQPLSFRRVTICPEPGCLKEESHCQLHAILRAEEVELISEVERSPYHQGLAEHGELEVAEEKPEFPVVTAPDGCKSCGQVIPGLKRDFCSLGCTKRAAFVGLPLKFPRTDKPRGRRGQP